MQGKARPGADPALGGLIQPWFIAMLIQMDELNSGRAKATGEQLAFRFRPRGGARRGAGRKPRAERVGFLPHLTRERHRAYEPVHVTARAVRSAPNLRSQIVFAGLRALFARSSAKGFRLLHFSVQSNHVHLIVEADDGVALARGVQRLLSRAAMAINALGRRSGSVWRDRHHREPLTTPSQVRNTYAYVLFNNRKHEISSGSPSDATLRAFDQCSSTHWFRDWSPACPPPRAALERAGPPIVSAPQTWLANNGWQTWGLLRIDEIPLARPRAARTRRTGPTALTP